ncbi:MAG: SMP-30/gluconolactonase/LRE family protein [Pirellulaceae bacterium]|nr:SMP-30/gluconolactonase/LRE family protein [Pirellulaceae bacterium]
MRYAICFLAMLPSTLVLSQSTTVVSTELVNRSQPLELVRDDFAMVDGAASNGSGTLFVPDVKAKKLYVYRPSNEKNAWQGSVEEQGAFSGTFFQLGEVYISDNVGARILKSSDGKQLDPWARFEDGARPNDLVVDRKGTGYVTMSKEGQIRRIAADGKVSVVIEGLESPNGITLSPDDKTLYVSLTKPGLIRKADVQQDGSLINLRDFAKLEATATGALADGMAIDRAGNVYCTGAEAVWIWNADGKLLDKIATPKRPINCTFGGQHGNELFISTQGGLYKQSMNTYGVQPNPPPQGPLAVATTSRPSTAIPKNVTPHFDVVYHQVGSRKLLCDFFVPSSESAKLPAIVLVHGGGWLHGDKTKFRSLALMLAERGYVVAAIEYRLGYEAKFPAGIQDCNAAVHFLKSNASQYRIDPERIAAVGGSAGGHLVGLMATGSDVPSLQPTPIPTTSSRVKAAVAMAGPFQIATGSVAERSHPGMKSNAIDWLGKSIDDGADLYHLADAYEKITADDPPVLFITGSLDNPDRDLPSLEKLKSVGVKSRQVVHNDAKHGHWNQSQWMSQVTDDIVNFLKEVL